MKNWLWALCAFGLVTISCGDPQTSNPLILAPPVDPTGAESDAEITPGDADVEQNEPQSQQGAFLSVSSAAKAETAHSIGSLTELEIRYDTPSLDNATLASGPIEVKVSYTAREDITAKNRPLLRYEIFYQGELSVKDYAIALGSGNVSIGDFDQDGGMEVAIQGFTGGAHCCVSTTVYSWRGDGFNKLSLDETLSGEFEDIDGDGSFEFVTIDSDFLAKFSSYAGSVAPPMVFSLVEGNFVNSTRNYPHYIYSKIADLEQRNQQDMNAHGLLAAYVANKSLVGEYESGWSYMLAHYNQDPPLDLGMSIRSQRGEVIGHHPDFPTALKAFLIEQGYW